MNPGDPSPDKDSVCACERKDGNEHMECDRYADSKDGEGLGVQGVLPPAAPLTGPSAPWHWPPTVAEAPEFNAKHYHESIEPSGARSAAASLLGIGAHANALGILVVSASNAFDVPDERNTEPGLLSVPVSRSTRLCEGTPDVGVVALVLTVL